MIRCNAQCIANYTHIPPTTNNNQNEEDLKQYQTHPKGKKLEKFPQCKKWYKVTGPMESLDTGYMLLTPLVHYMQNEYLHVIMDLDINNATNGDSFPPFLGFSFGPVRFSCLHFPSFRIYIHIFFLHPLIP